MNYILRAKIRDYLRKESVQEAYREGYIDGIADSCPICCKMQCSQQKQHIPTPEEKINRAFINLDYWIKTLSECKPIKDCGYLRNIVIYLNMHSKEIKEVLGEKGIMI